MKHEAGFNKERCEVIRPLLSALADGEATVEESARAKGHLASCEACASHYAFLQAMHSALQRTPMEAPSMAAFERIAAATYARPTLQERLWRMIAPKPVRFGLGALGMAVAVATVGLLVLPHINDVKPNEAARVADQGVNSGAVGSSPSQSAGSEGIRPGLAGGTSSGGPQIANAAPAKKAVAPPASATASSKRVAASSAVSAGKGMPAAGGRTLAIPERHPKVLAAVTRENTADRAERLRNPAESGAGKPTRKSSAPPVLVARAAPKPVPAPAVMKSTSGSEGAAPEIRQIARANPLAALPRHASGSEPIALESRATPIESTPVATPTPRMTMARAENTEVARPTAGLRISLMGAHTGRSNEARDLDIKADRVASLHNEMGGGRTVLQIAQAPTDSPGRSLVK